MPKMSEREGKRTCGGELLAEEGRHGR